MVWRRPDGADNGRAAITLKRKRVLSR
jgi:hypothetical protein